MAHSNAIARKADKGISAFLMVLLLFVFQTKSFAMDSFGQRELDELTGYIQRNGMYSLPVANIANFRPVLIAGFGNEFRSSHALFEENIRVIRHLTGQEPIVFYPPSANKVSENGHEIAEQLKYAFDDGSSEPKPFLLIGYSKGAVEAFDIVANHSDLVYDGIVAGAILIQAPVRGTPLAAIGAKAVKTLGNILPEWGLFNNVVRPLFNEKGMESLTPEATQETFSSIDRLSAREHAFLSDRVSYVTSSYDNLQAVGGRHVTNSVVKGLSGVNDNVVPSHAQSMPGFGTVIGSLYGQHGQFTSTANGFQKLAGTFRSTPEQIQAVTYLALRVATDMLVELSSTPARIPARPSALEDRYTQDRVEQPRYERPSVERQHLARGERSARARKPSQPVIERQEDFVPPAAAKGVALFHMIMTMMDEPGVDSAEPVKPSSRRQQGKRLICRSAQRI
jgi:hypothetical protein